MDLAALRQDSVTGETGVYKAVGTRGSRISRVLWMLEELEVSYEFVDVGLRSAELYAINPSGKSPVLIDGELQLPIPPPSACIWRTSIATGTWVPRPGLPAAPNSISWMHFAQSELEAPLWNKLRHRLILPKEFRWMLDPPRPGFLNEIKALDRRLEGREYALGNRFSAADVLVGDIGGWARGGRFKIGWTA